MSKRLKTAALALFLAQPALIQASLAQVSLPNITGDWQLLAIDGRPNTSPASFTLDDEGKVSGQAACNRYFGQNTKTLPEISLPNLGATRKLCKDMSEEDALFSTLSLINRAEIRQNHLLLFGPEGRVLEFTRDEEPHFCITCAE